MKKILIIVALLGGMWSAKAQQDPAYSMYVFNGLFINPAYAGSHEVVSLMAIYRQQWVGLDGAPSTGNISFHMPMRREQYAIGAIVSNDKIGLGNTFSFTPSFAYRIKIKESKLCFGIQGSFAYYYRNNSKSDLPTGVPDNTTSINTNLFIPNVGFGIYWYGKKFFVGASVPHLMPSSLGDKVGVLSYNTNLARVYNYYVFNAGYVFGKEEANVKFKPSILMKWQKGLPNNIPQFDLNLGLLLVHRIWIGASVRTQGDAFTPAGRVQKFGVESIAGYVQVRVTPQLQIAYSYDAGLSTLRNTNSGTHEVMLGYDFWYNKRRFVTSRYVTYF
jgi:type IX secretion system PorP/SprF family membrane protein